MINIYTFVWRGWCEMEKYQFDSATKAALEKLRVPLAVYQFIDKRVVTILLSDGFCELFGFDNKDDAYYVISVAGIAMFACVVVMLVVNFFVPILFTVHGDGVYHAGAARYVTLVLQVILFMMVSVYTFVAKAKNELAAKRLRRTVVLSGAGMAALIVVQMYYPMMPLYSMGFLFSSSLLHSFVVEDEKEEQRRELEETLRREQEQIRELGSAKKKIYTDPLTGVKSK